MLNISRTAFTLQPCSMYDCMSKRDISFWLWLCVCIVSVRVLKLHLSDTPWAGPNTSQHFNLMLWHVSLCVCVRLCVVFIGKQQATQECHYSGSCPVNEFGWLWITCCVWTFCIHTYSSHQGTRTHAGTCTTKVIHITTVPTWDTVISWLPAFDQHHIIRFFCSGSWWDIWRVEKNHL